MVSQRRLKRAILKRYPQLSMSYLTPKKQRKLVKKRTLLSSLGMNKAYKFSRYAASKLIIPLNSTTEQSQSYSHMFNEIANYSEFTQLFDQYMITGVAYYIRLITNPDNNGATSTTNNNVNPPLTTIVPTTSIYPVLWSVIDKDDDSVLTLAGMKEKQGVKRSVLRPNATIKRYVSYPRVSSEVYNSGITTGYGVGKPIWMDCNSPAVPHYGIKFCVDAELQTNQSYLIQIERKFYFKLKGVQ